MAAVIIRKKDVGKELVKEVYEFLHDSIYSPLLKK